MTPTIEVTKFGQIDHLVVPDGWVEERVERRPMQLFSLREFHPPNRTSVRIYVYYRGYPVSAKSGEAFEALLEKPPHDLDHEEWWSVQEVLRDAASEDAFERRRARTSDWADKHVLIVDGAWPRTDEESFGILINAADHGCQVQEIYYVAPTDDYQDYLPDALGAFKSIRWKEDKAQEVSELDEHPAESIPLEDELVALGNVLEENIADEFGLERGQRLSDAQLRTLERVAQLEENILDYDPEGNLVLRLSDRDEESEDKPAGLHHTYESVIAALRSRYHLSEQNSDDAED